jgi:hypothetical protein
LKFVDKLLSSLASGFNFIGDMLYNLVSFLAKPLSYLYFFFDGIFYFLYQLALIVWKIISIFIALLQFFVAIVAGFLRFITTILSPNFNLTPVNYPSTSLMGVNEVMKLLQPTGLLTVVPLICLAFLWVYFIKKMIGLLGGDIKTNA